MYALATEEMARQRKIQDHLRGESDLYALGNDAAEDCHIQEQQGEQHLIYAFATDDNQDPHHELQQLYALATQNDEDHHDNDHDLTQSASGKHVSRSTTSALISAMATNLYQLASESDDSGNASRADSIYHLADEDNIVDCAVDWESDDIDGDEGKFKSSSQAPTSRSGYLEVGANVESETYALATQDEEEEAYCFGSDLQ